MKKTAPYIIQKGDTSAKIAKKVYGDSNKWRRIKSANPKINLKNLKPGQKIKIPQNGNIVIPTPTPTPVRIYDPCKKYGCTEHTIKPEQDLMKVSFLYYGTHQEWHIIAKANRIEKKPLLKLGRKSRSPRPINSENQINTKSKSFCEL